MREKITFFIKLWGAETVEKILEDYTLKHYRGKEQVIRVPRKKKKKNFPNGMHRWTDAEDQQLIGMEADYREQGYRGRKLFTLLGHKFGVSRIAAYARFNSVKNKYGRQPVRTNQGSISPRA